MANGQIMSARKTRDGDLLDSVARLAVRHFSTSQVAAKDIGTVIDQIAVGLGHIGQAPAAARPKPERTGGSPTPSMIRRSVRPDALISFEDGKPYKTLRRHLAARGLTPQHYRDKWGLPADYPMVAANYRAVRAALAKRARLGERDREP